MKRILIDSNNEIIYEGSDALDLKKLLLADPEDVTEEDEVKYENLLRTLKWVGDLRYEVHFTLKFRGIDDWNRPVFKDIDSDTYFGSTEHLYGYDEFMGKGLQVFKENPNLLEYFGSHFNCEPHGGSSIFWKLQII